jgi:hypothetical protein
MVQYVETEMDKRQRERVKQSQRERQAAAPSAGESQAAAERPATAVALQQPATRKGDRWATFNAFMDAIAPRLTLAERTVWVVMFRHARAGTCDISERAIATQANIDKATAGKALRQLVALELIWVVFKSTSKEKSSRYGMQPNPADRLAAVIKLHDHRTATADARRQRNGGDRRGHRRKP